MHQKDVPIFVVNFILLSFPLEESLLPGDFSAQSFFPKLGKNGK